MTRTARRRTGEQDAGAATLEYAGFLFVIVLTIAALLATVTPVGAAIRSRICAALDIACGAGAAQQRAAELGITCVVHNSDRDLGYSAAYAGVRVERKDGDSVVEYGDGTARVTMSQGAGVGVDGSTSAGPVGSVNAKLTGNADLGYVYRFPNEFGGAEAAREFLGDERDGVGQAVDVVVAGAQSMDEGLTRVGDSVQNWWEDDVLDFLGAGPSAEERAQRQREQQAGTADAVAIGLSLQGSVGADFGAGVQKEGAGGGTEKIGGPLSANAGVKMTIKGSSVVALHAGQKDSVSSYFAGSAAIDAEAGLGIGLAADSPGGTDIPPFLNLSGQAGAAGAYVVVFDEHGEPAALIVQGEYYYGGQAGFKPPKIGGKEFKLQAGRNGATVSERKMTLDLRTDTPEGRANRDAFDAAFTTFGTSVNGHAAKVAVPNVATTTQVASWWPELNDRLTRDAFIVDAAYTQEGGDGALGLKVAGTGLEGTKSGRTRQLVEATAYDNRNGGVEVALASCGG